MIGCGSGAHDDVKEFQQLPTSAGKATYVRLENASQTSHSHWPLTAASKTPAKPHTATGHSQPPPKPKTHSATVLFCSPLVSSFICFVTCLPIPFSLLMCLLIKSRLHICYVIPPRRFFSYIKFHFSFTFSVFFT